MSAHSLKKASPKKRKAPVFLDSTRLCKQCVIGCTVLPSRDDPELTSGVALTTLNAFDESYVKFEDIDGLGDPSYRYWKDVYLIVAWNDPHFPPLKVGDKAFALYQNPDKSFTTVYYHAQLRAKPNKSNGHQMVIDFLDGTGQFTNIRMAPFTKTQTTSGLITVPTVIRRMCASNTAVHRNAMQHLQRSKQNKARMAAANANANGNARRKPTASSAHVTKKHNNNNNHHHTTTKRNHSISVSATPSERFTPLKKTTKSHKKQVRSESDSDSPIVLAPAPSSKSNIVNNINIGVNGVGMAKPTHHTQPTVHTRKRKYDEMNSNRHNNNNHKPHTLTASVTQPPLKRQRSSRRKAQKLKLPTSATTTTVPSKTKRNANIHLKQTALQRNVSNASTISNVSNISSTPAASTTAATPQTKSNGSCAKPKAIPEKQATPIPRAHKTKKQNKKQNKKRTITIKRKKKNVLHSPTPTVALPSPVPNTTIASVKPTQSPQILPPPPALPTPPPMPMPSVRMEPSIKQSNAYKALMAQQFPERVVLEAIHKFGNDIKRGYKHCQNEMRRAHKSSRSKPPPVAVPTPIPIPIPSQAPQRSNTRKKFKKMWGNYEIEMPVLSPHGFQLFDNDLYLDNFKTNVQQMSVSTNERPPSHENEWFMSGLGIRQKWTEPQEIGEITVGPYVVDMDIMEDGL